ncbi:hypothetical protein LTR36_006777 [Oleoguttula mirabilis]|uniref:BTB domain-containing protein n=1 Tax=Oleoguttula mirabilis TaxID=1507867 RepID=A0AAV9JC74_9PEZI|nr:hypothetical protein LTR36_006777 [Oleoguttula mirabilis]
MSTIEEPWKAECSRDAEGLLLEVGCLFKDPKYSDLRIKCGDRGWKVHKAIICPQSDFFAKACEGGFKEAQENLIALQDDDPDVVHAMLRFMYTGDFDNSENEDNGHSWGMLCVGMHATADKYNVADLGSMAAESLRQWSSHFWAEELFTEVVREVYTNLADRDSRLRNALLSVAAEHVQSLFAYRRHAGFREMVGTLPGFLMALASELAVRVTDSHYPPFTDSDSAR